MLMYIQYWKEVEATSKLNSKEERKMLNTGNWNLRGLMIITLIFMGLLYFQTTDASAQTNQAMVAIDNIYSYHQTGDTDTLLDEPVLMREGWGFWVANLIDTGEDMDNVKFTVNTTNSIVWEGQLPSSESPPIYIWDYRVAVPEDSSYQVGGRIEPGPTLRPGLIITRRVTPEVLSGPWTVQTVSVEVTFTSGPPETADFNIGDVNNVLYEGLVTTETISQNDVAGWTAFLGSGNRAGWHNNGNIELGVTYIFVAEIRSVKSSLIIGNPVWKPSAGVGMYIRYPTPDSFIGTIYSLSHPDDPDGVTTYETSNSVEWLPYISGGKEFGLREVLSDLTPCGDGEYCLSDGDGDGIPDADDLCPDENATGFDADQDGCIDSITGLADVLITLVDEDVIDADFANSLIKKVENAQKSTTKDNICAAVNQLGAFINEIEAQTGKKLSEESATFLIEYTNNVITWLLESLPEGESCD